MTTDWETNFADLQAKLADVKLVEGTLLSLSLSPYFLIPLSLSLPLLLSLFSLLVHSFCVGAGHTPPYDLSFRPFLPN